MVRSTAPGASSSSRTDTPRTTRAETPPQTKGQPQRQTVCECERGDDSNLAQTLQMYNGKFLDAKMRDGNNRFRRMLKQKKSNQEILRELYLAALSFKRDKFGVALQPFIPDSAAAILDQAGVPAEKRTFEFFGPEQQFSCLRLTILPFLGLQ